MSIVADISNAPDLICDKCGSNEIIVYMDPKEIPKPKKRTLAEWTNESQITTVHAVMTYNREIARCLKCGYKVERWR